MQITGTELTDGILRWLLSGGPLPGDKPQLRGAPQKILEAGSTIADMMMDELMEQLADDILESDSDLVDSVEYEINENKRTVEEALQIVLEKDYGIIF